MLQASTGSNGPFNFPQARENVQLDLVGLLAVVGESSMTGHVQPVTASLTALLPRLLPAPQSFLRTDRPWRLPPNPSPVVGVHSGNFSSTLNFFPELLHGIDQLDRFSVRTISIRHNPTHWKHHRRRHLRPHTLISIHRFSPANILSLIGTFFFLALLTAGIILQDGMAILAVILLATTSSLAGLGSLWTVDLQRRATNRDVPDGDVVVIGRQGSFLHIQCPEPIARELYFGLERCNYFVSKSTFRILAGVSMFLFMAAVVFMANCTWNLQAGLGLSYIMLNGLYWLAALIPGKYQWDMSAYVVERKGDDVRSLGYTQALTNAVRIVGGTEWIETARVVPRTEAWGKWVKEAGERWMDPEWDGDKCLTRLLREGQEKERGKKKMEAKREKVVPLGEDAVDIA